MHVRPQRRVVPILAAVLVAVLAACGGAHDESAGTAGDTASCDLDTVTILVSSEPGAPVDIMARTLADALADTGFEPSVVVETRTGGSGAVAMSALVSSRPDGGTLYAMTRSQAVLFAGGDIEAFGPDALDYLVRLQDDPYIWAVRADSPFQSLDDLVAHAKANPGDVSVGGFGSASAHHLAALTVAKEAGIEINWVPYEGGSGMIGALLGGFVDVANANPGQVLEAVRAGDVRVLGISSEEALDALPDTPTFRQAGIDFVGSHWRGVVARAGMPEACLTELETALTAAYEGERFQSLLEDQQVSPGYMPREEFTEYVLTDVEASTELLVDAGLKDATS